MISATSGPQLTLAQNPDWVKELPRYVASGFGFTSATGECYVDMFTIDPGEPAVEYIGSRNLSREQRAAIVEGSMSVVKVAVVCEQQADR
jgi:hypothetical protein